MTRPRSDTTHCDGGQLLQLAQRLRHAIEVGLWALEALEQIAKMVELATKLEIGRPALPHRLDAVLHARRGVFELSQTLLRARQHDELAPQPRRVCLRHLLTNAKRAGDVGARALTRA